MLCSILVVHHNFYNQPNVNNIHIRYFWYFAVTTMITIILSHFTIFLEIHFWSKEYLHDKYFQVALYKGVLFFSPSCNVWMCLFPMPTNVLPNFLILVNSKCKTLNCSFWLFGISFPHHRVVIKHLPSCLTPWSSSIMILHLLSS